MSQYSHPNLIPGEVYYGTFEVNNISQDQDYLILAKEEGADYRNNTSWINPYRKEFGSGSLEPPRFTILRPATALEKEWLIESDKANKFIEKPIDYVVNQFPIY